uniref:Uncharacterized protein n=1 Tax=Arundo donax TaxID=35708 RepID=A0A0A8ZY09_ARUDO
MVFSQCLYSFIALSLTCTCHFSFLDAGNNFELSLLISKFVVHIF